MKHPRKPISGKERSGQLICDGKNIRIPVKSFFEKLTGKPGAFKEISLTTLCDYREVNSPNHGRRLILYSFHQQRAIAEWTKVKRLPAIDTSGMDDRAYASLIEQISNMVATNQQFGLRRKDRFYTSMTVSLDFG